MVPADGSAGCVNHIPNGMCHEMTFSAEVTLLKDTDSEAAVAENIDRHTWKCCESELERHSNGP